MDIEKKYTPKPCEYGGEDLGDYLYFDFSRLGERGVKEYHSIQNKELDELNEALSERLGVVFVEAEKDDVIPNNFYSILNCGLFADFERSRINTIASIETEIEKIDEQISELEGRKYSLREYDLLWKHRCAFAANSSLEKIVKEKRININEKIPHLDMYPLEIAEICQNKELYETLLRQGATDDFHFRYGYYRHINPLSFNCWYGFFKLFPKTHYRLSKGDCSYIVASLHELSDNKIKVLLLSDNVQFKYKDLEINDAFVKEIRRCFREFCDKDDIISLLRILLINKRYKAIGILESFFMLYDSCSPFIFWLFCVCVETKNLDALKYLRINIWSFYFDNEYYFREIKEYYKEEYLGSEMMAYIKANTI